MALNRCYDRTCDGKPVGDSLYCPKCEAAKQAAEPTPTRRQH